MNVEFTLSSRSLVDCVNKEALSLQQLLIISERLVTASNQAWKVLKSTTAVDQVNYYGVCLVQTHPTCKCSYTRNPETSV